MNKDTKKLVAELERQGFRVHRRKKSPHHLVDDAAGRRVGILADTPSDYRGWRNTIAQLRRHGFVWPAPRHS